MDIDYHFCTMYVLSRWADFGSANSKIIATSAQLVDDNMDDNPFSDQAEEEAKAQGINIRYSSFTMSTTTAETPDGSRSARRLLVRLSVG